ncbi:PKD domain-containing protein [Algoriphagus oliviformis]|uniref:PKD domain-containing protein n=1 Tax=Algoriphagus oliviformis TaxID=2811231 RepID=UPI00293D7DCF|nr:PKD domain-containing protein [Algoriphagus oliviformis]
MEYRHTRLFFAVLVLLGLMVVSLSMLGASYPSPGALWGKMFRVAEASFTFTPNGQCANTPIVFTNTSTGTDLTYLWNFGDGQTSTEKNPTHTFTSATGNGTRNFTVKLSVTEGTNPPVTTSQTVTVKEIPSLKVNSDQETTTFENLQYFIVCENQGSEFTFYNAKDPNENNLNYQIDWGDGSPAFSGANWTELKHTYAIGIYNLTYTVTPANGCTVSRKFGVFIGSNPAVGLGNPGNTNVCIGEQLTFPITGTANNPAGTIYTVTFSDGSTPQVFTHPPPPTVSHTFSLGSCGKTADGFPNSFSVKIVALNPCSASQASVVPIYVSEPPIPKIQVKSETVCVDETVQIQNVTDFKSEVSTTGSCNENKRFVWEISPAAGWTVPAADLGTRPNPTSPNSWSSGKETLSPKFTTPGTYTVKLITGNRCGIKEETKTIVVIPRPEPSFTLASSEVCGPATVQATNTSNIVGLAGAGTYSWSVTYSKGTCGTVSSWDYAAGSDKNSESPTFLFKNPGIYTISLSIVASCGTFKKEEKVTVTAPPTVSLAAIPLTCGPTTFTPKATVTSCGSGAPTYLWTFEGGTPASSTALDPGPVAFDSPGPKKITLEVTSACGVTKVEKTFAVANPPKIDLGPDQEICKGEELELKSAVTEGSGKYSYKWTSNPATSIPASTSDAIRVKPGANTTYLLTVTDTETKCVSVEQIQVSVLPAPTIQFSLSDLEICSGESIPPITITSSPAGEPISWTAEPNGVTGVATSGNTEIPQQILENKTGKPIEVVYTAIIASPSQGNCAVVPAVLKVLVHPEPAYTDQVLSICSGEELDFTPPANLAGTSFTWTVSAPSGISGASSSSAPSIKSLKQQLKNDTNAALEVIYTLTPSLGACTGSDFALKVTVQPAPSLEFSSPDQSLCTGSDSKAITISSDVPGATFSWTANPKGLLGVVTSGNGPSIPSQNLVNPTSQPITLEYQVNVQTNSGGTCSGVPKTYRITVNPSIILSDEVSDQNGFQISCFGANDGKITLNPTGGSGTFSYSWTGPNGFASSSNALSQLDPGSYQVLVKDEFGCEVSKSFEIREPQALRASLLSTTQVLCAGDESGAIELTVAGGVDSSPYLFEWKRNGTLFPKTSQNLVDIPAGSYEVTVKDANGCVATIQGIEITEPAAAIVINYTKTDISCYGANDGSLDLDVSGGLPPYQISWAFGSDQSGFDNLGPGDYTLTVSDQSGCIRSQTITIKDAPLFKVEPKVGNISCYGARDGFIELKFQGGVGATSIRWDHGQQLENLYNLEAGHYAVTIKDQTDCEIRSEFNIVEPALLKSEPKVTDALDCDNPQSGEIRLGISGGTPPYSVRWSNGQTTENLLAITSGQYAATITDASGCTIDQVFEVKRPAQLSITAFQSSTAVCDPRSVTEEVRIAISGGVAPYSISWSGGTISPDRRTMTTQDPGYYQVTVVDGKGCLSTQSFNIDNSETIAESEIESAAFDQYNSFLVNFEVQFWNRSFGKILSYHWDFGDGSESFEENPKHTYTAEGEYEIALTVTDIFGCPVQTKKKIEVFDYYLVVPNAFTPNGDGINDYFFPKFVGIESLEFWVLNKWGETIFYTKDMNSVGWDGKLNKEVSMPGNYVYKIRFKTPDGRMQTETDLFLLLK